MFKGGIILGGIGSGGLLSTTFLFLAGNAKNEKTRENFFGSVLDGRKIEIESLFKNRGGLFYAVPQEENGINGELKVVKNKDGKGEISLGFDSGCEFVRSVLGADGNIKYLGEKGRKLVDEELKNEDWQKKTVKEVLKEGAGDQGCLIDKIFNPKDSEFRPHYLIDVSKFSSIRGQSGLINFGKDEKELVKPESWGIYRSEKNFSDVITKIRIIEGKGKGRELTYDLYISTEWTKQIENWKTESNKDKDIVLSLVEFWPREGSEDSEQKGLTNLIWKKKNDGWMFANFKLGIGPAVENFKDKVGYLGEGKCIKKEQGFNYIEDGELCVIDLENFKNQKWQSWFPKVLEKLEKSKTNEEYPFEKDKCKNLEECIQKVLKNSENKGDMIGVWGEVGILDDNSGVRWRSF
ncbi:hypothetical protein [Mycoplasma parvum]|uniref:Uncharacterized protein n=1 Tax=Mycoplasma parvum str. Indiana TaxID=1403316 RepID=U5NCM4_9MOLU|nr:hypothetical protein [Mycoplasma parvum]AGX89177.1 hypothetical protein PRV_02195 [Mycoplasma parvum str. Indiana]